MINKNENISRLNYYSNIPEIEIVWNKDNKEALHAYSKGTLDIKKHVGRSYNNTLISSQQLGSGRLFFPSDKSIQRLNSAKDGL